MKYKIHKTLNLLFTLLLFAKLSLIKTAGNNNNNAAKSNKCTLTGNESQDPFPSLSKCYKYNNEACCLSVHDDYINEQINMLLSESCIRKYAEFENLMCFGCHPMESKYIDKEKLTIKICKKFALRLWNNSETDDANILNKTTTIFDNCGFKVELFDNLTDKKYIIPSQTFGNFTHFFKEIKIPFYEDYTIEVVDGDEETCYNHSPNISPNIIMSNMLYLLLLVFFYLK